MSKNLSADEALQRLKEGNQRSVANNHNHPEVDASRKGELTGGQSPYAIVLSCADSRVVPEYTFDEGLGRLFVIRVAGNIANTSSIASIEYAVANLGTKLVVVLGHESCGAVTAALGGGDNGYNLNHLVSHIVPAVEASDSDDVNAVVKKNAELTAKDLLDRSEIIRNGVNNGGVKVVPAYYNLKDGSVDFL